MRVENHGTRYFSFQELAGVTKKENTKKYSDKEKIKFAGECKACKKPMEFIVGTNVFACKNPECRGFKHVVTDKEGNEIVSYSPSFRTVSEGSRIKAERMFVTEV